MRWTGLARSARGWLWRPERRGAAALVAAVGVVIAGGAWAGGGGAYGSGGGGAAGAGVRRPRDPREVVARVPSRALDPGAAARQRLARQLAAAPRDLASAVRLARLDVEAARASADPRFLGRAEA